MNAWNYDDDVSMKEYAGVCMKLINEPHGVSLTQEEILTKLSVVVGDYDKGIWYTTSPHLFKEDMDIIVAHMQKKCPEPAEPTEPTEPKDKGQHMIMTMESESELESELELESEPEPEWELESDSGSEWQQEEDSSSSSSSSVSLIPSPLVTPPPLPTPSYTFTCKDMTTEQINIITRELKTVEMDVDMTVVQVQSGEEEKTTTTKTTTKTKKKTTRFGGGDGGDTRFFIKAFLDTQYDMIKGSKHIRTRRRIKAPQLHRHFEEWYTNLEMDNNNNHTPPRYQSGKTKEIFAELLDMTLISGAKYYIGLKPKQKKGDEKKIAHH